MVARRNPMFQFPSNGKAYPKNGKTLCCDERPSASFNSLQTGKRIQSLLVLKLQQENSGKSFNSLQTGKRIQSGVGGPFYEKLGNGFNSLQTGKRIQSIRLRSLLIGSFSLKVSIPFKRESVSKVTSLEA